LEEKGLVKGEIGAKLRGVYLTDARVRRASNKSSYLVLDIDSQIK